MKKVFRHLRQMSREKADPEPNSETFTDLLERTDFTSEEIRKLYKDFMNDYPDGHLSRGEFQEVYASFFPKGDCEKFTEHVLRTFDTDNNGKISFREFMCAIHVMSRANLQQKLQWAFCLYDIDGNGYITRTEMVEILRAIYKMKRMSEAEESPEEKTDSVFKRMDKNVDGKLCMEEFIQGAQSDLSVVRILEAGGAE